MFLNESTNTTVIFLIQLGVNEAPPTAWVLPIVVKPRSIAGDDDVVSLLSHIVFTSVDQPVDFRFTLLFIILQRKKERLTGQRNFGAV